MCTKPMDSYKGVPQYCNTSNWSHKWQCRKCGCPKSKSAAMGMVEEDCQQNNKSAAVPAHQAAKAAREQGMFVANPNTKKGKQQILAQAAALRDEGSADKAEAPKVKGAKEPPASSNANSKKTTAETTTTAGKSSEAKSTATEATPMQQDAGAEQESAILHKWEVNAEPFFKKIFRPPTNRKERLAPADVVNKLIPKTAQAATELQEQQLKLEAVNRQITVQMDAVMLECLNDKRKELEEWISAQKQPKCAASAAIKDLSAIRKGQDDQKAATVERADKIKAKLEQTKVQADAFSLMIMEERTKLQQMEDQYKKLAGEAAAEWVAFNAEIDAHNRLVVAEIAKRAAAAT